MFKSISKSEVLICIAAAGFALSGCAPNAPDNPTLIPRPRRTLLPTYTPTSVATESATSTPGLIITQTETPTRTPSPTIASTATATRTTEPTRIPLPTATRKPTIEVKSTPIPLPSPLETKIPSSLFELLKILSQKNCGITQAIISLLNKDGKTVNGQAFDVRNDFGTKLTTRRTGEKAPGETDVILNQRVTMRWDFYPQDNPSKLFSITTTEHCDQPDSANVFFATLQTIGN